MVEILLLISAFFCLSVPSRAQEIQLGDTIVVCGYDNTFLASANAIGKKGPVAKFQKHLVSIDFNGKEVAIVEKYNATQFRVSIDNTHYLLSVGKPKAKKAEVNNGILYYIHKSFVDSLKAHYLDQPFYQRNGDILRYEEVKIGPRIEVRQKDWASITYSGARPSILTYVPGQLTAEGKATSYSHVFRDETGARSEADLLAERDARWTPTSIDSLRAVYVGDTLALGHNLYDIKDSINVFRPADRYFLAEALKACKQYSQVVVDSVYSCVMPKNDASPQHLDYRIMIRPVGQGVREQLSILIDDVKYPQFFLTSEEYAAYLEEQRRLKEKRLEYIAISEQEWLEQQRALDEYELQLQEIYANVYGEDIGLDIWWGRIKFGFTEEMCKNAYRNSGMYRVKEHVSTPLGDAKQIHYIQRQIILYFIKDRLIGVTIYGKTTWDNVF